MKSVIEWFNISDKLPVSEKEVSVFADCEVLVLDDGDVKVAQYTCGEIPQFWYNFDAVINVTHWAHLPEKPKL